MKALPVLSALVVGGTAVFVILTTKSIQRWTQQNAELTNQLAQVQNTNNDQPGLDAIETNSTNGTTWSKAKLIRLRSEVGRLRYQRVDVQKMRTENARLKSEIASAAPAPRLADLPGFTPRSSWSHAGLLSPEQALQSFFRAARDGDIDQFLNCMAEPMANDMRKQLERDPVHGREGIAKELKHVTNIPGYRISQQDVNADGTVALVVEGPASAEAIDFVMQKQGNEWRAIKVFEPRQPFR